MKTTQEFLNSYLQANLVVDGIIGTKSHKAIQDAVTKIRTTFAKKEYKYNIDGVNIFAFRTNDDYTDTASDWFVVINKDTLIAVPCSTKAGRYYVYNPISYGGLTGTAVLLEGQYRQSWQFITASSWQTLWLQTPYFQQIKPVKIFRDGNKNNKLDRNMPVQEGLFGINIHTAGLNYTIWNWSAGCIVIPRTFWLQLLPMFTQNKVYDFTLLHKEEYI
jgi:hypothetical protein